MDFVLLFFKLTRKPNGLFNIFLKLNWVRKLLGLILTLAIKRGGKRVEGGTETKKEMIIEIDITRMIDIETNFKTEAIDMTEETEEIGVIGEEDKETTESKEIENITSSQKKKDTKNKALLEKWLKNKMKNIDFM